MIKQSLSVLAFALLIALPAEAQLFSLASGPVSETPSDSRSVNFLDLNNDGWEDLYISNGLQGGQPDLLYLNDGQGQLIPVTDMDIVEASNPSDGASFADYNNDGHIDGVISSWYGAEDLLYLNDGTGNLVYNDDAGIVSGSFAETAAFGDYDNDGWLDLLITNSGTSRTNFLYRNLGNNAFERITDHPLVDASKLSRGAIWGDFNNDRQTDVFVTNEGNSSNDLILGRGNGKYEALTTEPIVTERNSSMTASWGDVDNDRDLDVFVGNSGFFVSQNNQLFRNMGGDTFEEVTDDPAVNTSNCTFGSAFGDYDNDGDLDLVIANGFCNTGLQNTLYENQGDGTFVDASSELGTNGSVCSFGAAWGDVNNDGYLDLAVANCKNSSTSAEPANSLMINQGSGNNWLKVQLTGTMSNRNAIGAQLEARAVINGEVTWQLRDVQAQSGYAGQNSLIAHFGLGSAVLVDTLIVHWPAGNRQILTNLSANQTLSITEVTNISNASTTPQKELLSFEVFPNLITDSVAARIQVQNQSGLGLQEGQVFVYNILGQTLYQEALQVPRGRSELILDVPSMNLASGTYYVVLHLEGKQLSQQLIIR